MLLKPNIIKLGSSLSVGRELCQESQLLKSCPDQHGTVNVISLDIRVSVSQYS